MKNTKKTNHKKNTNSIKKKKRKKTPNLDNHNIHEKKFKAGLIEDSSLQTKVPR